MTETQEIQTYLDEIYGQNVYMAEYEPFKGFYARSVIGDHPQHLIFLGETSAHAHSKLDDLYELVLTTPITLSEAAVFYPLAYSTLAQAVREGRIEARQSGPKTWITTRASIEKAIEQGKLRPRK